jgi:fibronectin type 3 domain-containing protein
MKNNVSANRLPLAAILLLAVYSLLAAAPQYFVIPDSGRVYVVLAAAPAEMTGFTVQRQSAGQKFQLLTPEPVAPISDPEQAMVMVGEPDYTWLAQVLKTDDPIAVLSRLKHEHGTGQALSLACMGVARVLGRVFIDSTARTGKAYTYRITFLKPGGELALYDENVSVARHPGPALKLSNLAARAGIGEVRLTWNYPRYTGDPHDITVGFNLYRRPAGTDTFVKLNSHVYLRDRDTMFFVDRPLENDRTYDYCLSAVDVIGAESPRSAPVTATPRDTLGPLPPATVKTLALEGKVQVTWPLPSDSAPIAGYNVYRSWSIHGEFARLNPALIPTGRPLWIDTNVVSGKLYVYRVRTVTKTGKEGRPSNAGFASPNDTTPPPPPLEVKAAADKHIVHLTWQSQPTPDLAGYYVYRAEGKDNLFRLNSLPLGPDTTEYTDSGFARLGLYPGQSYRFAVSQVDYARNESKRETTQLLIPDDRPPFPPATVYARSTDDGHTRLDWQTSMSSDVAKYRVYRASDSLSLTAHPSSFLVELPKTARDYLDTAVARGRAYWYSVAAVDSAGNETRSSTFKVTPADITPPAAPAGFKAVPGKGTVELSWQAVKDPDLAGYNVYRADSPSGVPAKLNKEPVTDTKLTDPNENTDYYYWVQSLDTSGNESPRSDVLRPVK